MSQSDGEKPPTLGDLAKAAGVSKGTASNVFNRPKLVREEVRVRVLETARGIGYRGPDPMGRMLSAGRANAIGVATMEPLAYLFEDPFARRLMAAIAQDCQAEGVGLSLVSAAGEDDLAWSMESALVDGFILFCLTGAKRLIQRSRERRLPFVALDLGGDDETLSVVGIDNVEGARRAARHLVDLGHRRFVILAMETTSNRFGQREEGEAVEYHASRNRLAGYREVLAEAGIDPSTVPVFETLSDDPTVHAAMEALFSADARPTAILAQSDRIALIALAWLKARGICVPGEVSLVGFDDVPEASLSDPALTTISQPIEEIGRRAVRLLMKISRTPHAAPRRECLDTRLVVRGSSGPASAG
ncbi:DNA-binding LacI/PurR family transcriptional regulator [Aureimonas pseudogalii]|uniref:DNA-binding LacI/PurR family transcriptional regulator n=1 Tax=Aureimonas pseudogalii TaxID=1744844 RepID=A0A7W6H8U8_9HYPH|nr:LacI family DNA-binding transcriptional regulator [Aureimonas pseudogalii]MBB4000749.1 DNA-binding LacI/PurR family transcriptional regulator [Aureimonas pseudogalii]